MKKYKLLILLGCVSCSVHAQHYLNGAFQLSNIKYAGSNLEFENTLHLKHINKTNKKEKEIYKQRQILGFANLGFYANPNSHFAILNTYGVKFQKLTKSQLYYNSGLGLGFNTNFLGETYTVADDGTVEKKSLATRSYWTTHLQIGVGRQFKSKRLDAIFLRQNVHLLLNYNYGILPIFNTELGVRIQLLTDHNNEW